MPNSTEVIREHLQNLIAAEKAFEERLREFATEGDDEEVQLTFADHADETHLHLDRLRGRLAELGSTESSEKSALSRILGLAPRLAEASATPEERLVQNLITAFCVETGECAMYEALASAARACGDRITEDLARNIQAEERRAAEKIFHFLPSRSKIAFNVLTAGEIDPAVETKVGIT